MGMFCIGLEVCLGRETLLGLMYRLWCTPKQNFRSLEVDRTHVFCPGYGAWETHCICRVRYSQRMFVVVFGVRTCTEGLWLRW